MLVAILAAVCTSSRASASAPGGASPLAFFRKQKKEYTPLLFFKAPKGMIPECDFVERMVSQIEKELGVKVERFDVMRGRRVTARIRDRWCMLGEGGAGRRSIQR